MALYLGKGQIAECMRSGKKVLASELIRDGRNPGLLVLPEWADPPHPQERPFIPDDVEGAADYPMAPDNLPDTGMTLIGNVGVHSNTVLLLHMDGANNGQVFTDSSTYAHTMYVPIAGDIVTSTAVPKFGTASSLNVGATSSINATVQGAEFAVSGGAAFTAESWIYRAPGGAGTIQNVFMLSGSGGAIPVNLRIDATGKVNAIAKAVGGGTIYNITGTTVIATNTWAHVALVRSGNVYTLYLNGVSEATTTNATVLPAVFTAEVAGSVSAEGSFNGRLDEFRFVNGTAVYTSNFTPPVAPFTDNTPIQLTWTLATLWGPRAKSYTLRRSTDGGAYTDISVNLVDYTNATGHVANIGIQKDYGYVYYVATTYTDSTITSGHIYAYQAAAVDDIGDDVAVSNVVTLNSTTGVVTGNPSGGDANFANVVLLQHGDGANDGVIFTDSSVYNHAMANSGSLPKVVTKTAVAKFGTASIFAPFNANSMGITAGLGAEWSIANTATDFTLECFFQQVVYNASVTPTLFILGSSLANNQINLNLSNGGGFNYLRALGGPGNGNTYDSFSLPKTPITSGVWHFATLMRKTNVYYLFLDGTLLGSITPSVTALTAPTFATVASNGATSAVDQVYIDDIRFTVGTARYPIAGPVPVPTAAFPNF